MVHCVAEDDPRLSLLSPPPECWDDSMHQHIQVMCCWRKTQALRTLGKHSTNRATIPAPASFLTISIYYCFKIKVMTTPPLLLISDTVLYTLKF